MRGLFSLFMIVLLFVSPDAFCQKTKVKAKVKPPTELFRYQDYSYPYYAIINNGPSPVTGCFISYKNISYFVTTRHSFYTTTNERRKITNVMIFVEPGEIKNSGAKVISLNMTDQKIMPVCFDFGCTDILLLPVSIPKDLAINYVSLELKETLVGKEMFIVGYIKDSLNVVKTQFDSFLTRDSTYFLTEKSSPKDQSGAPVLMYTKTKGVGKVILAGIYSGKEISQDHFDKGLVSKAAFITKFLSTKTKKQLLGED